MSVQVVGSMAGHHSPAFRLARYGHLLPDWQDQAALLDHADDARVPGMRPDLRARTVEGAGRSGSHPS
jgi:hypothetical protein